RPAWRESRSAAPEPAEALGPDRRRDAGPSGPRSVGALRRHQGWQPRARRLPRRRRRAMKAASGIAILGAGRRLAGIVEENAELCRGLGVTPEWIVEKTGIQRRYLAAPEDTASGFAVEAARQAMERAGVGPGDIDLIVACTFSGDYTFPPLSAKVHKELGVSGGQIFDL